MNDANHSPLALNVVVVVAMDYYYCTAACLQATLKMMMMMTWCNKRTWQTASAGGLFLLLPTLQRCTSFQDEVVTQSFSAGGRSLSCFSFFLLFSISLKRRRWRFNLKRVESKVWGRVGIEWPRVRPTSSSSSNHQILSFFYSSSTSHAKSHKKKKKGLIRLSLKCWMRLFVAHTHTWL